MNGQQELLEKIKALIEAKKYRIRIHAVRHMIEEGFTEGNIIEALMGEVGYWKITLMNSDV